MTRWTVGLLAICAGGCGYSFGFRAPQGVGKIAVPVFRNDTFPLRREVEVDLTRAVRKAIARRTDLQVVPPEGADAVLEGTVRRFDEMVLAETRLDRVSESSVSVWVDVAFRDLRTGKVYAEVTLTDSEPFSLVRGETLEGARREAVDKIAERIILLLEGWDGDGEAR